MATWRSSESLRTDPWIAEQIALAVAEYEGVLLPEELAWMADQFFEILANVADRAKPRLDGEVTPRPSSSDEKRFS